MKKTILFIAILIAATSSFAFGQMNDSKTERDILKLNNELKEAILNNNAAAAERILADDFTYSNAMGMVENKAQQIAKLKSGRFKFERFESDNAQARVYKDAAIVIGVLMSKGMMDGKSFAAKERYTTVFVKNNGRWQVVAVQSTAVME